LSKFKKIVKDRRVVEAGLLGAILAIARIVLEWIKGR
jgi:hypothetical protein